MKLLIFGYPGSGKGTAAACFCEKHKEYVHISTGDMLRKEISEETELGKQAKHYIDQGHLVPDDLISQIVLDTVKKYDNLILDGFPRTVPQAKFLHNNIKFDAMLWLFAKKEAIIKRMLNRGRKDDSESIIKERIKIYEEETYAVAGYYLRDTDVPVLHINSEGSIDNMMKDIYSQINELNLSISS